MGAIATDQFNLNHPTPNMIKGEGILYAVK
jgi:hypothetical protein